jgi:hypothetical protein
MTDAALRAVTLLAVLCLSRLLTSWDFGPDRSVFPEGARQMVTETLSGKRFDA